MSSLFVIQGRDQGRRFELEDPVYTLGRDNSNRVQLHDTEVSRRHAEFRIDGDSYAVIDLDSSNGCFVNSERVRHCVLKSGDRVQVGRTLMIFTGQNESPSEDLSNVIEFVGSDIRNDPSRILSTAGQDESELFQGADASASPWLARARSNLQIMYRTALAVSHTLDIDQLLQRIMEMIFEWVETDRGCVMLVDLDTQELSPKVRRTRKGVREDEKITISQTILDYVMEHKEGVLTSDAREDGRWDPAGSIVKLGVREAICVPMQGRYGIVGVIYIDTYTPPGKFVQNDRQDRFTEDHLKLMVAIGHQAALAVEDTSYYSALVQAERLAAVGQTIAMLSHHIKNILQGIRGGSYLIEEGLKSNDPNTVRTGWGIVDRNQDRISNLVMDMLTFSKDREPEPVLASLNEVTADVVELMNVRAAERKVQLLWQPDEQLPEITFDPEALHRAILNVVTNAIDACNDYDDSDDEASDRQPPQVTVSTEYRAEERAAAVVVVDNGSGIEPGDMKKIFTVFESRKGSRGTGLGLPVSKKILQEHGGEIVVDSQLGEGSTFTLLLPIAPTPAAHKRTGEFDTMFPH